MRSNRQLFNSNTPAIYDSVNNVEPISNGGIVFKSLAIVIVILLIISIGRYLLGNADVFTLSNLLTILQNSPDIDFVKPYSLTIDEPWDILDGLRKFINLLGSAVEVFAWCGNLLIQVMDYIVYLLVSLLGVPLVL